MKMIPNTNDDLKNDFQFEELPTNTFNRGQQLIHGKEEAGEAPVKGKCRKKLRKKQSHYVSERRS